MPHISLAGKVLAGRYELLEQIGAGGMSVVYKARNKQLDSVVCVKVLRGDIFVDEQAGRRLRSEAKVLAALDHPNILKIVAMEDDGERMFIVTEFVEGRTLATIIKDGGVLNSDFIKRVFGQIGNALQYAHAKGIVHRDLKPGNVMITGENGNAQAKILDFGIAKMLDADTFQKLTRSGMLLGTPHYMAPEQCAGAPADARTDIYSLGCMLQECLTGRPAFEGNSPLEVMLQHLHEAPDVVPGPLGAVAARAIQKQPEERFQSSEAFMQALQSGNAMPPQQPQRSRIKALPRKQLLALLAVAAGIAGGLAFFALTGNREPLPGELVEATDPRPTVQLSDEVVRLCDLGASFSDQNYTRKVEALLARKDMDPFTLSEACALKGHIIEERDRDLRSAQLWQERAVSEANKVHRVNARAVVELAHLYEQQGRTRQSQQFTRAQLAHAEQWGATKADRILLLTALANSLTTRDPWLYREAEPVYEEIVHLHEPGSYPQAMALHRQVRNLLDNPDDPTGWQRATQAMNAWKQEYYATADDITRDELDWIKADIDSAFKGDYGPIHAFAPILAAHHKACDPHGAEYFERVKQTNRFRILQGKAFLKQGDAKNAELVLTEAFRHARETNVKQDIDKARDLLETALRQQGKHGMSGRTQLQDTLAKPTE